MQRLSEDSCEKEEGIDLGTSDNQETGVTYPGRGQDYIVLPSEQRVRAAVCTACSTGRQYITNNSLINSLYGSLYEVIYIIVAAESVKVACFYIDL